MRSGAVGFELRPMRDRPDIQLCAWPRLMPARGVWGFCHPSSPGVTHRAGGVPVVGPEHFTPFRARVCNPILMPRRRKLEPFILHAALEGLELQRQRIGQQIAQVRTLLGRGTARAARPVTAAPAKRTRSLAARRRMSAAQRKRWAEFRKRQQEKLSAPEERRPMRRAVRTKAAGKKRSGQ